MALLDRIRRREAIIAVMGLGYAGLPMAVQLAAAGSPVIGYDVDGGRVDALNAGVCHVPDVPSHDFDRVRADGRFRATADPGELESADVIIICVPTPLSKTKDPDISYVMSAAGQAADALRPGQLVILESTTYPGTTEELILPTLEAEGLRVGEDFFLAFSSERVDPGNSTYTIRNTPKVVGGVTARCLDLARAVYEGAIESIVPVSSPTVAELSKLMENTFRAVNIALANELAQMARVLGVDVWEVIDAAATKPFGFMPFYPGPGLGGHCIPIDPQYLAWKLRTLNYRARFVEMAGEINAEMPGFVVDLIAEALNERRKCLNGARVLLVGVAYKPNSSDLRESPALDLVTLLRERHAVVRYVDRHVPTMRVGSLTLHAAELTLDELMQADCVVIVTAHDGVDYGWIAEHADLLVDSRNATRASPFSHRAWKLARPQEAVSRPSEQLAAGPNVTVPERAAPPR